MKGWKMFVVIFLIFPLFYFLILTKNAFGGIGDKSGLPLEVIEMQDEFEREVSAGFETEDVYLDFILQDGAGKISACANGRESQYFVYADRNPKRQLIFVCFFDSASQRAFLIGADKTSTGNPKRSGYFLTPVGVFENTIENVGYRALGTENAEGWRGLGEKGSRVWDFGWQKTSKNGRDRFIRLLIHATDPTFGEPRLGQADSKGCVRISGRLNKFLDFYGILDKEYEEYGRQEQKNQKKFSWLLAKNRKPAAYAGRYFVVGDSGL